MLPAFGIDPYLITIQMEIPQRQVKQARDRRIRADVQFVRLDPVCGDRVLCCLEVELPDAN